MDSIPSYFYHYVNQMTGIITKQNAKDKAFIGGSGGGSSTDGEFDTLHVKGESKFDGIATFNIPDSSSITSTDIHSTLTDHESRITSLESSSATGLPFIDGANDFIIDVNTISESTTDDYNTIDFVIPDETFADDFFGDVFEIIFPSMNLHNGIISIDNHKFTNPVVSYSSTSSAYSLSTIVNELTPRIYFTKDIITKPMELFTSGFMRINYIANVKTTVNSHNGQLVNIKANIVEAHTHNDACHTIGLRPPGALGYL